MAFYGIGNLFGPVPRPDVNKEAEAREEAEKKKAEQEKAELKEQAVQEKATQAQEQATQAESQRQRLLQLQDKVARKLEEFVRASGRERTESSDATANSLLQDLASAEGDSFTPENLQRLRQLSQNAQGAVRAGREGRAEAPPEKEQKAEAKPQISAGQDFELQARRAAQELKNQRQMADEEKAAAKSDHARTEAKAQKADPESAKPLAGKPEVKAELAKPEPAPPKAELAKTETPRPEAPKAEAAKPEAAKAEAPKAEPARPEAVKAEVVKPEPPKAEPVKNEAMKPELPEGPEAKGPEKEAAPPPPRPDAMRPRVESPAAKTPEAAKPEGKAPEAKAEPEAAKPRTPGPSTPAGEAAPRPDGLPAKPGQPGRPEAAKGAAPRGGESHEAPSSPAPEGPKTAKGQETAGGASFAAGGTPTEKAKAKEGDLRFAPHLKDSKPPQEGTGKAKPEPKQEGGTWSAMGMGGVRQGPGSPSFLRPMPGGLPFGARPGAGRPGEPAEDDPTAGLPRTPTAGTPPRASLPGKPLLPSSPAPSKPQAPEAPPKDASKAMPEPGKDAEPGLKPSWSGVGSIGYRPPMQQPGRGLPGPGLQQPGGQEGAPAGREPVRRDLGTGGEPPRPAPNSPLPPQLGHVAPIRIPPPDGGKDDARKRVDDDMMHGEDIGIGRPPGGPLPKPVAGPGATPGVAPVRGPREERGPVGRVDGWQPDSGQESPHGGPSSWEWDVGGVGRRPIPRQGYMPRQGLASPQPDSGSAPDSVAPSRPRPTPEGRSLDPLGPSQPFLPRPGFVEGGNNMLNFELLRRSPFRAENEEVFPGEGATPGAPSTGAAPRPPGWTGMPIGGPTAGAAFRPQMPADPGAGAPKSPLDVSEGPTPRVEFLRPRASAPRPGLLGGGDPAARNANPGSFQSIPGLGASRAYEAAERARMAQRIMSGDATFLPAAGGSPAAPLEPVLPGEVRAIAAQPATSRSEPTSPVRSALPRGPLTGGRPVTAHIPIYQPVLDLIYNIRGKGKVEEESTPIKMTLSGSVGVMERETYTPPPLKAEPQVRPEEPQARPRPRPAEAEARPRETNFAQSQRRVFDASDANPLLGQMTGAAVSSETSRAERHAPSSHKPEKAEGKTDVSTQSVVEIGDPRGRGGRGGSEGGGQGGGDQRGQGGGHGQAEGTGEAGAAARGGAATPEQRERMQAFRLASTHQAFRITMDKLENQVTMRRYELAVRNANTSIESILKRVYRDQELADLDEDEAVNSLLMMLKLGGEFTYAHSARVLDFAMELADEMGITDSETRKQVELGALLKDVGEMGALLTNESDEKIEKIANFMSSQDMRKAGMLHDIGKLRIPPEILYKPGRMTDEEYAVMKMHPIYGEQMIYPIASLRHLCPTIRGHHERWDGKGYPDGLAGERIPLPARILAVADVFDALQAERPYKSGMDVGRVREILEEGKGTHFDPDCVEAFMRVLDRRYPQSARRRSQRIVKVLESVDAV